jgi:UDPglucose--hexose-1-phosphate uridylyltransferase
MRKTSTALADGRELIYFDHDETAAHTDRSAVLDRRVLDHTATTSTIRYDEVLDEWVAIASHRQGRTHLPPPDQCPLCPSRDGRLTEVPSDDYDVVVFENRFPSFTARTLPAGTASAGDDCRPGLGRCEVVCFTSDHDLPVQDLTERHLGLVLAAWTDRTVALSALPYVEQVFAFENRGEEIGVTLSHPHGQIYGYPFVTPRTRTMLATARAYRERTGRDVFTDRVARELAEDTRVVATSEHWVAFVPFSARWPVEVHLYPRSPVPDLPSLAAAAAADFASIYLRVLRAVASLDAAPMPYISGWHQAPVRVGRDLLSLHLELFSIRRAANRLKYLAGSESGMDAFINDVTPEDQAARLRAATGT